jgi:hypothetical protein
LRASSSLEMKNFLITAPFALPLYILPISLWLLNWFYLIDPYFKVVSKLDTHTDGQSIAIGLGQLTAIPALPFIGFHSLSNPQTLSRLCVTLEVESSETRTKHFVDSVVFTPVL